MCHFGINPGPIIRPSCFAEKVGVILQGINGKWYSHQKWGAPY